MTGPPAQPRLCGLPEIRTEGLVLVDKPVGPTSHAIVQEVRRLLGASRAGHGGTLDPFASGLLIIAAGRATRLLRFLSSAAKTYIGDVKLGFSTDTDDATGRPLGEACIVNISSAQIEAAVGKLSGAIEQIAPAFSARKHEGVRHYRLARQGKNVPRKPFPAQVAWRSVQRPEVDLVRIEVTVTAGTYIRALARDLGTLLGCGGHLVTLRRTTSGPFHVGDAISLPSTPPAMRSALYPVEAIPLGIPTITLDPSECRMVRFGRCVPVRVDTEGGWVRLLDENGGFLALAEADTSLPEGPPTLRPRVVF